MIRTRKQIAVLLVERPFISTSEESEVSHSDIRSILVGLFLIARALFIRKCFSWPDGFGGFAGCKGASLPTTKERLWNQD